MLVLWRMSYFYSTYHLHYPYIWRAAVNYDNKLNTQQYMRHIWNDTIQLIFNNLHTHKIASFVAATTFQDLEVAESSNRDNHA